MRSRGVIEPVFVERVDDLADQLRGVLRDGDVVLTMGAGNIGAVAHDLKSRFAPGAGGMNGHGEPPSPEFSARVLTTCPCRSTPPGMPAARPTCSSRRATPPISGSSCASCRPRCPLLWIGLGSNLLVRDGGVRGAVISTHGALSALERVSATRIHAEAGVPCARIARQCVKWGLGPAEFFAGIPGTLGGALAMNAGAWGGETWRHVIEVDVLDRRGIRHTRTPGGLRDRLSPRAGARRRMVHRRAPGIRTSSRAPTTAAIRELLERRKQTQPIGEWSCGSVFTNPPGEHAARLIETAGLKGFRIGDASVSEKHANFIINHGAARAADIEAVILHVQRTVAAVHDVALTPKCASSEIRHESAGNAHGARRARDPKDFGKVAVLLGGDSSEREISLLSGNAVLAALKRRGVDAHAFDPRRCARAGAGEREIRSRLDRAAWTGGEDGLMQGALEWLGIPYTGSGVLASALTMDKLKTKRVVVGAGLVAPEYAVLSSPADLPRALADIGLPLMVKPASQGSSVGITKVKTADGLAARLCRGKGVDPIVFAERFISGEEYTVGVLQDRALPSIRIEPATEFYDYEAKYFRNDTKYHCPSGLDAPPKPICRPPRSPPFASPTAAAGDASISCARRRRKSSISSRSTRRPA